MTALLTLLASEHLTPVTIAVIEVENLRSAALLRRLDFTVAPTGHSSASLAEFMNEGLDGHYGADAKALMEKS